MAYTVVPPYQVNADPYFTRNTSDIMRDVMNYAQNTQNQRGQARQYWQGTLPFAYNESMRDQMLKVLQAAYQGAQGGYNDSTNQMNAAALNAAQHPDQAAFTQAYKDAITRRAIFDAQQQNALKALGAQTPWGTTNPNNLTNPFIMGDPQHLIELGYGK